MYSSSLWKSYMFCLYVYFCECLNLLVTIWLSFLFLGVVLISSNTDWGCFSIIQIGWSCNYVVFIVFHWSLLGQHNVQSILKLVLFDINFHLSISLSPLRESTHLKKGISLSPFLSQHYSKSSKWEKVYHGYIETDYQPWWDQPQTCF